MSVNENKITESISAKDHVQGPATAPLTLVEYGDYECPYCGKAYSALKAVQKRMGNHLRFVFRNFPLKEMHPHAFAAAEAAEAAGAQGKFWEMHDTLYEHQDDLEPQALVGYAKTLGLDVRRFVKDVNAGAFAAKIEHDFKTGLMSGVNGTPSLFINGEPYDGGYDAEPLLKVLQGVVGAEGDRRAKAIRR
jgi:protein-disulfide isomerase